MVSDDQVSVYSYNTDINITLCLPLVESTISCFNFPGTKRFSFDITVFCSYSNVSFCFLITYVQI